MKNLIPASEGHVAEGHMELAKKELLDVLTPILDGWDGMADGFVMAKEAMQGAATLKSMDAKTRKFAILAALVSIGADAGLDMLVIYPEEETA